MNSWGFDCCTIFSFVFSCTSFEKYKKITKEAYHKWQIVNYTCTEMCSIANQ